MSIRSFRYAARWTLSTLLISLVPGAALAQQEDAPETAALRPLAESLSGQAKEDYSAALILYDDGDYAGAVVKFLSAYDASKDARLLWNAAACQKSLRHYAKAMILVRRYLEAGASRISDASRKEAETFLDAVTPLTARLSVVTGEPDAQVFVDKELVGTTPLVEALFVDLGQREVVIRKEGYEPFTTVVKVTGSHDVKVTATLKKIVHQGHVTVHARPGDTISFDGHGVGSGTWEATVPSGGHTVRVTAPGKVAYQSELLLQDGQTRRLDVSLKDEPGGIPAWLWIAGSTVVAAGAATAGYFIFRSTDSGIPGTIPPQKITLSLTRGNSQ